MLSVIFLHSGRIRQYPVAQKVAAVLLEKEKEQEAVEERRKQEQRTDQHR